MTPIEIKEEWYRSLLLREQVKNSERVMMLPEEKQQIMELQSDVAKLQWFLSKLLDHLCKPEDDGK